MVLKEASQFKTVVTQSWTVGKHGENLLGAFERKVLRKIFGLVLENGCWRKRNNPKIHKLCAEYDAAKFIKLA
jgi:hypothetical protein